MHFATLWVDRALKTPAGALRLCGVFLCHIRINDVARVTAGNNNISANYGASTFIIISIKEIRGAEKANAACVIENMLLAATDLGLGSVYTWTINFIHKNAEIMASLGLPVDFLPVFGVAIGYPLEPLTVENQPREITVNYI
jgi:nitroreductase